MENLVIPMLIMFVIYIFFPQQMETGRQSLQKLYIYLSGEEVSQGATTLETTAIPATATPATATPATPETTTQATTTESTTTPATPHATPTQATQATQATPNPQTPQTGGAQENIVEPYDGKACEFSPF